MNDLSILLPQRLAYPITFDQFQMKLFVFVDKSNSMEKVKFTEIDVEEVLDTIKYNNIIGV